MEICELAFFTDDVAGMTAFYEKLLGKAPDYARSRISIFTIGAVSLLIHANYSPDPQLLPPGNHFALQVDDVDAVSQQLVSQGIILEHAPRDFEWGRSAYLRDPEGQFIELAQR